MLGTIANSAAIIIGGLIGLLLTKGLKERYKVTVVQALGMAVLLVGLLISMGNLGRLPDDGIVIVIVCLAIGSVIGEWLDIEKGMENIGKFAEKKFAAKGNFSKGFVTASLLFCAGAMAITGAIESGLTGNNNVLYTKAIIDGIFSIIFTSSMGMGVIFSAVPVFIYQGAIALGAGFLRPILPDLVIYQMASIGGILVLGIGLNVLDIKKIKVGNMIPAVFIPVIYYGIKLIFNF
jgi:uncharacterized protein